MDTKELLKNMPTTTGVYLLSDPENRIIYIGKAKNIRARLHQHFRPSDKNMRAEAIIEKTSNVEYILTENEVEALILENNLIRKHQPRYNIVLKDDKSYPWVKVTEKDDYPQITVTRNVIDDGSKYYGPYVGADAVTSTLKYLRRFFRVRKCGMKISSGKKTRPCLDYQIQRCMAPCAYPVDRDEYRQAVSSICLFLEGRSKELIENIRREMKTYAAVQEFEHAAELRDLLYSLERTASYRQSVVQAHRKNYDAIACAKHKDAACVQLFIVRDGKLSGQEHFLINNVSGISNAGILSAFIKQYYSMHVAPPPEIHLPVHVEDADVIRKWLSEEKQVEIVLKVPRRKSIIKMAEKNAESYLQQSIARTRAGEEKTFIHPSIKDLMNTLPLTRLPVHIEALDISENSGRESVGSVVVFENGRPNKSEYRRFRIKSIPGQDDFAMLSEVALRRYSRTLAERKTMPDLVVVDGGRGQLSAVLKSLQTLKVENTPVISIAKKFEQVYTKESGRPVDIPRSSPALKLLQQIRDEAHRFALSYHRNLRGKMITSSQLGDIPGIGKKRISALLRHFGTIEAIKQASVDALAGVPCMNRKVAINIRKWAGWNDDEKI